MTNRVSVTVIKDDSAIEVNIMLCLMHLIFHSSISIAAFSFMSFLVEFSDPSFELPGVTTNLTSNE